VTNTAGDPILDVFSEGLGVPRERLSDETSPDNTSEWDSLAAMTLVTLLEERFSLELTTAEIMRMRSIGAVRQTLRARGVSV
jgi:acyl carrier protein